MGRKSQKHLFGLPAGDLAHVRQVAGPELDQLRGRSIFLTGGTGFFGKWILGALDAADEELDLGLRVTVLSRDPDALSGRFPEVAASRVIDFQSGDVAAFALDNARYDFVIHAATETTAFQAGEDERARSRTMVEGTRRVLELMRKSQARRLLYVSSGAVYGPLVGQLTGANEDDFSRAQALIPYGVAKRAAEELCRDSGLDFVSARGFAFLGPYLPLDAHFAAGNFLRDALKGGPILVRGDGTALRSYLHPADLVIWLLRILLSGQRGRAYNVGSDEAVTTAELARLTAAAVTPACEVTVQAVQAQGPQNIYLPDITRARTELGLDVYLPLREAITRTVRYHRALA